jgi:hypothetical protein
MNQNKLSAKYMAVLRETDPRPVAPLDPARPLFDAAGRKHHVVTSSSKQVVTSFCGFFGVWDRKTGDCLIAGSEAERLSNECPRDEWVARRREAAMQVLAGMHADAAIERARVTSSQE